MINYPKLNTGFLLVKEEGLPVFLAELNEGEV